MQYNKNTSFVASNTTFHLISATGYLAFFLPQTEADPGAAQEIDFRTISLEG